MRISGSGLRGALSAVCRAPAGLGACEGRGSLECVHKYYRGGFVRGSAVRGRSFSHDGPPEDSTDEAQRAADQRKAAIQEVHKARRKQREEQDEASLFNSAFHSARDSPQPVDAAAGADPMTRRRVIDMHVATQVATVMGSLINPETRAGVPSGGMTYSVGVDESTMGPGAGRGLVLRGEARPGDLIAFYPGTVYTTRDIRWAGGYDAAFTRAGCATRDYFLSRVGGIVIDGLSSGFDVPEDEDPEFFRALEHRDRDHAIAAPEGAGIGNFWANGHFINHPPKGGSANVIGWPYDFPVNVPESIQAFIPNTFALGRSGYPAVVSRSTICMIAASHISDGEEVYLDYGFELTPNTDTLPSWFHPAKLRGDALIGPGDADAAAPPANGPLENAKVALIQWRDAFAKENGRAPTREELETDPVAGELFEEFQRLSKLEWRTDSGK